MNYRYPEPANLSELLGSLNEYARLRYEEGADKHRIQNILHQAETSLRASVRSLEALPVDPELFSREPNDLPAIRTLRPEPASVPSGGDPHAPGDEASVHPQTVHEEQVPPATRGNLRRLWKDFDQEKYREKLDGALTARFAGCLLGAAVEQWSVEAMKEWAEYTGDQFPPTDYWSAVKDPVFRRYMTAAAEAAGEGCTGGCQTYRYTRDGMDGVPLDDDIVHTLHNLLVIEEFGPRFATEDVATSWLKYFPYLCYVHTPALRNLNAGVPANQAALVDNPRVQNIAADIRADTWGYVAPGLPEVGAELAYRDAYFSHRRNGIYGSMFYAAAIAAAFQVGSAVEALEIGLNEIPRDCLLAKDMRWALSEGRHLTGYADARAAAEERFDKMSRWHTNVNACLTAFGLMIGGDNVTRVLGEIVAMGFDNDCNAASAGSIIGAIKGKSGIPVHWYRRFNNKVLSFLKGYPVFTYDDLVDRFSVQAQRVFQDATHAKGLPA